jgi:prolyl 4-hydroxylase
MADSSVKLLLVATILILTPQYSENVRLFGSSKSSAAQKPASKEESKETWVEHLSWKPRAMLIHNFLAPSECEYMIEQAKPHMTQSSVVDSATGKSKLDSVRTSSGMFLVRGQDEVVSRIEARIAAYTMIPQENGEGFQVLQYLDGQKYSSHFDYFHDEVNTANGGQRVATMLMYLTDVEEGGETVFPSSLEHPNVDNGNFSACAQAGVAVKPKTGDALFFYSLSPQASMDPYSLHGGCPVIKGAKWSATKWMRVGEYKI